MRRIGLLSLLAGIVGLASQVGLAQVDPAFTDEERAWLAENPTIRIAPAPNFPPIEFFDEEGEYKGIAKDYATILESKLGVDLAVERRETWNDVVEATKLREIDVWMEAADTPERREFMNFTAPYITLPAVIIVRRELRGSLRMGDMEGLRIAVVRGYAIHDYIRDNYPELELMLVGSIEESLEKVSFGSADAVVANVGAASFYIERGGLTNLRVAGESGFVWKLSMAARNDWPLLQSALQKALDSITEAERRSIYRRWIALEATSEGWTRNQILLAAVALAIVLTFVGIRWIGRRKSDIGEIPREATLSESWPVMATALASIVLVVIAAVWTRSVQTAQARQDVANALRTVLNTSSQALYDWFRERENETRGWAERPAVRERALALADRLDRGVAHEDDRTAELLRAELEPLIAERSYAGFLLLTPDGRGLLSDHSSRFLPAVSVPLSPNFISRILENPSGTAIDLPRRGGTADEDNLQSIVVGALIRGSDDVPRCILGVLMNAGAGFTEILDRGRIGESGETYAINRRGQLVSESRFQEELRQIGLIRPGESATLTVEIRDPGGNLLTGYKPVLPREQQPLTLMAEAAVSSGRSGADLDGYRDYRGVPVIGTWVWDEELGLGIATEMDVGEAYVFLRGYHRQVIIGTSLTIALILGLTAVFIRNRMQMTVANAALTRAYGIIKKHKERMEEELNVGREIQMSMIPLTFPAFPERREFSVYATLKPAREVGGDFYDFFFIDDKHFCFCIGDVSGKGVPSALFMAVTQTLIKSRAADDRSTASILSHVNDELSANNRESMFVTVFLAILNIETGLLHYTNAGHNPPYIKRADGSLVRLDARHGPIVGAVGELQYGEDSDRLASGDLVYLYTDGVTEAMDVTQSLYSEERLQALLETRQFGTVDEAVNISVEDVWKFQGSAEQADDVTVLAVLYSGQVDPAQPDTWTTQVENRLEEIDRVNTLFNEFADRHGIANPVLRRLNMAFDELLNNIISYAFEDDAKHVIELTVSVLPDRLRATFRDDGRPFDPFEIPAPDTTQSVEDRPMGGVGVYLVQKTMDTFTYERREGHNLVTLEKLLA